MTTGHLKPMSAGPTTMPSPSAECAPSNGNARAGCGSSAIPDCAGCSMSLSTGITTASDRIREWIIDRWAMNSRPPPHLRRNPSQGTSQIGCVARCGVVRHYHASRPEFSEVIVAEPADATSGGRIGCDHRRKTS